MEERNFGRDKLQITNSIEMEIDLNFTTNNN